MLIEEFLGSLKLTQTLLVPLAEVAPGMMHPLYCTIDQLLADL